MKISEIASSIGGKRLDEAGPRSFIGRALTGRTPAQVEEVGTLPGEAAPMEQDWSAVVRAWTKEPELTLEERLRALEEWG